MVFQPSDRSAARWNTHLRFALTTGLRFSAHSNENTTTQKGDISNKLTMGTFLKSFDNKILFLVDKYWTRCKLMHTSDLCGTGASPEICLAERGSMAMRCPRTIQCSVDDAGALRATRIAAAVYLGPDDRTGPRVEIG